MELTACGLILYKTGLEVELERKLRNTGIVRIGAVLWSGTGDTAER
jgi:hypothetical protein